MSVARVLGWFGRTLVALVSAALLAAVGFGWFTYRTATNDVVRDDVIAAPPVQASRELPRTAQTILLVGLDSRTDNQGNPLPREVLDALRAGEASGEKNTDTMMVVHVPADPAKKAFAISLPRDSYVDIAGGFGKHKLNSAYARGLNAAASSLRASGADNATVARESVTAGRRNLIETVSALTGLTIDHYAEINLLGFSLLTEAVGGVEVCLREPVNDKFSGANFPAGPQMISGPDALAFVRQRHGLPGGDLDRIVRQQAYLAALADKVLSAGTLASPTRIRQLIDATQQSLVLDEDLDLLDFAARMQGLAAGNVMFKTVPVLGDGDSESDGAVLKVDPGAVQAFVAQAIDVHPAPDLTPGSPARAAVTVDVLNASGVTGLASSVSEQLVGQGFRQGAVGNTPTRATSVVRYPASEQDAGAAVADTLGGLPVEEGSNLTPGTVQVFLGRDYSGPVTPRIGGASLLRVGGTTASNALRPVAYTALPPLAAATPRLPMAGSDVPCVS
jgi:LCP family protein required for cell wall assembly